MIEHRHTVVLYTTAVCNLNCRYCFIDKNPALQQIDKYLEASYLDTPNYYLDFAKEAFLQDRLQAVQFWGGEPSLGFHRAYGTIEKFINYFPNLREFMTSTNFVSDIFFQEFFGLINILKQHPDREFKFYLQLSIDGPEYITDNSRGKGVTKNFIAHFNKLIEDVQNKENLPDNVSLFLSLKPTLDSSSIQLLQTKEAVKDYFIFFEQFQKVYIEKNHRNNVKFNLPIPNTAVPSQHTKEDGQRFANYCKITRELELENKTNRIFSFYKYITSYVPRKPISLPITKFSGICSGHCGNGRNSIGLLPNRMVSCCHNGFVDLISDYKRYIMKNESAHLDDATIDKQLFKNQHNSLTFSFDSKEFETYQKQLDTFYCPNDASKVANMVSSILFLANTDQIDEKYKDKDQALEAAYFLLRASAYCVRDNLTTGSIFMYPPGLMKLLLNGAKEIIEGGLGQ